MYRLRRVLFLILAFIIFLISPVFAGSSRVMSLSYDDSSSLLFFKVEEASPESLPQKFGKLSEPNRIYFDFNDSVLIGSKQDLVFEKSPIKEIKLAQFSTNPDIVRAVVTFEENFDTSKIKLINSYGNLIVLLNNLKLNNNYFNPIYDENPTSNPYSSIVVNSLVTQRIETVKEPAKSTPNVVADINKAFNKPQTEPEKKIEESVISVDISSILKLRSKYFINGYYIKNGGLLVSGLGQITISKIFTLDSPKRVVLDLPDTYVDRKIRNRELVICPDGSCKDTAKIGQFEFNKARIVINTETPEKYIPVYSSDSQSIFLINADNLQHTSLSPISSNIQKVYVKKINSKTTEMIIAFTEPVVHSLLKDEKNLNIFLFNVKSYNEPDIIKTLSGTYYKHMTFSLLPQIGVKVQMKIDKDDSVQISQGMDGKALKLVITRGNAAKDFIENNNLIIEQPKQTPIKNKIVIDPGHGGTDYGAIRAGINEKDITLDISMRVASILKAKGYKIALTRNDDRYLELQERCDITEVENPEIFVSIHVNSAVATEPYGIETHYYHDRSKKLAEIVQKHMLKNIDSKDRGVQKSKFYVINHTEVPAILVEIGFLSNVQERTQIITEKRKQATAKAIADGIMEYLKK